ncbi:MAG: tetratricopeptide repeat protein, partial [Anaerolineae bacterium]|nr:tetratricopeptide repeat protein [Phycisphaerae bacterium]
LLSGSLPFDANTLRSGGYNEIQRIIREVDPPRPSTRLTRLGVGGEEVARCRQVSLENLSKQLKSELEWIPLKAMRKERADRYASPTELAEDLQNYLSNRPLRAGPESPGYRARKFLRRNKTGVAASAAMFFLLVSGIITTTWQAVRASREKQQAILAKDSMREVNRFLTDDLLASASPEVTRGKEMTVREAVDVAAESVSERFKGKPDTEAAVHTVLADTYNALGLFERSRKHAQAARALLVPLYGLSDERVLDIDRFIGSLLSKLNRNTEAESLLRDVLARCEKALPADNETLLSTVGELAATLRRQRRFAEAEPLYRRCVEADRVKHGPGSDDLANSMNSLAVLLADAGRDDEAEPLYREALAIRKKHGIDYPQYLTTLANIARLVERRGRLDEAEAMMRESLETRRRVLKDDHPSTLLTMNDLATLLSHQRKLDEAEALHREALERRLRTAGPEDLDTLQSMNNLGKLFMMRAQYAEAEPLLRQAYETRKRVLSPTHPHTLSAMGGLVQALVMQGKWAEAEPLLQQLKQPEYFDKLDPLQQAVVVARLSTRLADTHQFAEAEPMLLDARRRLIETKQLKGQREVLQSLMTIYDSTNRPADAARYRAELNSVPTSQP